jgi:hypothetical protein
MGMRGGVLESLNLSPLPMKTWPWEVPRVRGNQIRQRGLGRRDGKVAQAKKAVSHAASSPHGEPCCQIIQRASEDTCVSLERRHENHDRAIDNIGKAGKNVKVTEEPIYNLGCLALTRQQRFVVWPDKFRPDIGACYDGTSNPVEFL